MSSEIKIKASKLSLIPLFLKHLIINAVVFGALYLAYKSMDPLITTSKDPRLLFYLIIITLTASVIKIIKDLFFILITTYHIKKSHIEVKEAFIREKSHLITYDKITDIKLERSVQDKIIGLGTILIYTANDIYADKETTALMIRNIKNSNKIKDLITRMMNYKKRSS